MPLNVTVTEQFTALPSGTYTAQFTLVDLNGNNVVAQVTSTQFIISGSSYQSFNTQPLTILVTSS